MTIITIHRVLELPSELQAESLYLAKKDDATAVVATGNTAAAVGHLEIIPAIDGPAFLVRTVGSYFYINNWSDALGWDIVGNGVEIARDPGDPAGFTATVTENYSDVYITIGPRELHLPVQNPGIVQPSIVEPADGHEVSSVNFMLSASPFELNSPALQDTQLSADWEIAEDPGFTTVVQSSYDDTVNLASWKPSIT